MTEKRFTLAYEKGNWWAVRDRDIILWKEEVVGLLNELNDKCEFLEIENESLEDGATKYAELYHKSLKENEQLKSIKKFADRNGICIFNIDEAFRKCWNDNAKLVKENEELKGRVHVITREYMDWKFSARKFHKKYQSAVKLLRVIKHELMTLNNLRLVDSNNDLVYVNFNDLLEKIEEEIEV